MLETRLVPAITMEQFPTSAPNSLGSPSFAGWTTNAINGLENNISTVGNPQTDPTAYYRVSNLGDRGNIVSGGFTSWHGVADPGTVFGPAFANELGNRLLFGLHILGNGTQFRLSNLSFALHSSDPSDTFQQIDNFSTDSYTPQRVGINYGPDHIKGTGDDVRITSGPGTQLVDELMYVGAGGALPNSGTGTPQEQLDAAKATYDSLMPFHLTMVYTLVNDTSVPLAAAPPP